jgi:phosphoribosylanthranilate isomerase
VKRAIGDHGDAIAVGLDVRGTKLQARGWTEEAGDLWEMLDRLNALGVARYIVTDVNRDGMMQGPNIDLLVRVMEETEADIIASGGVSSLGDLTALATIGVEGVIVGKAIYAGAFSLAQALAVAG